MIDTKDIAIIELNLLKEMKFRASLYSDMSSKTQFYGYLLELIEEREQKILKPNELQDVNNNEQKGKGCCDKHLHPYLLPVDECLICGRIYKH